MMKRDLGQRSCRMTSSTKTPSEVVPLKGAHIRKSKTPLKRGRRHVSLKRDSKTPSESGGRVSCRKCRHESDNFSSFQEHNCVEESELYQCHTCKLLFNHRKRFQEHMKQHRQNECKMCGQQFLRRKALLVHSRSMHGVTELEKYYSCSHCDRKFIKRPSLISHLKTHAGSTKIVCVKCGKICENAEEHAKHVETHESETKFECVSCSMTFRRRQQYDQHMAGHNKHNCHVCHINFSTKKSLEKHLRETHDISKPPAKNHECNTCGKKFYRPATLKKHMQTHENAENPIKCEDCKKRFCSASSLAKHKKTSCHNKSSETEKSSFHLCAICGNQFTHAQSLNRHILYVHGDQDDQVLHCKTCSYKTRSKTNMKRHLEIHEEKRYVCEICGNAFHALATLKEHHIYLHSDKKDFTCGKCNKSFKLLSALQRHERIHKDARPFVCHCGQKYKRKSHLKRHVKIAHDNNEQEIVTENIDENVNNSQVNNNQHINNNVNNQNVNNMQLNHHLNMNIMQLNNNLQVNNNLSANNNMQVNSNQNVNNVQINNNLNVNNVRIDNNLNVNNVRINNLNVNNNMHVNNELITNNLNVSTEIPVSRNSVPCSSSNDLMLLNDCQQSVESYLNPVNECQQVVDEISYLNSEMMQIPDDVMPICQRALEQSMMALDNNNPIQVDTSNSLICPMSVLDTMEMQPSYCLQNEGLHNMTDMMMKHPDSYIPRDENPLDMDPNDCGNMNMNAANNCNFESYLCALREPYQYDPSNYQFNF